MAFNITTMAHYDARLERGGNHPIFLRRRVAGFYSAVDNPIFFPLHRTGPIFVTSLGRIAGPGMKVGCLVSPLESGMRSQSGVGMSTGASSRLQVEIAARWIRNGYIRQMEEWQQDDALRRVALLSAYPALSNAVSLPNSPHIWLGLPDPWRSEDFVDAAAAHGIAIAPTHSFVVGGVTFRMPSASFSARRQHSRISTQPSIDWNGSCKILRGRMAVRPDPRFEPCEWSYGYEKRLLQLMKLLADHWPIVIDSMTCLFSLIGVLPNFVWSGGSIRPLISSGPARPYIARLEGLEAVDLAFGLSIAPRQLDGIDGHQCLCAKLLAFLKGAALFWAGARSEAIAVRF